MITYKKGEFVKCKSIKVATLRGWIIYPITVGKLYEIQRDSYHCDIINDRGTLVTFESIKVEELFMDMSEIREEKLKQILDEK